MISKRVEYNFASKVSPKEDIERKKERQSLWKKRLIMLIFLILIIVAGIMTFRYVQADLTRKKLQSEIESELQVKKARIGEIEAEVKSQALGQEAAKQELSEIVQRLNEIASVESMGLLPDKRSMINNEIYGSDTQIIINMTAMTGQEKGMSGEIYKTLEKIGGQENLGKLLPFYNLKLAKVDFRTNRAALIGGQAWFINDQMKLAVALNLENKSITEIKLDGEAKNNNLTAHNKSDYFQIEMNGELANYNLKSTGNSSDKKLSIKMPDKMDGKNTAISAGENNIYFWQIAPEQIYRLKIDGKTEIEKAARGWWTKDAKRDENIKLESISDLAVDNSLWLAQNDGLVVKMTNGATTKWQIKDLTTPLTGKLRLDTDYSMDDGDIYILASEQGRVLVVNKKTGEIRRDIRSESFDEAKDILIDEARGKFYVVGETDVFELNIAVD